MKTEKFYIFRTYSAGVFFGNKKSLKGTEAIVTNCRRLWYWKGAASLSQLSMEGLTKPKECKFPCEVTEIRIKDVIEVIPCTEKAESSIKSVPIWEEK